MKEIVIKVHNQYDREPFIYYVCGEIITDEFIEMEEAIKSIPEIRREGDYHFVFSFKYEDGADDNGWSYELLGFYPMDEDGRISDTQLM